jgi:hypothetical protein
LIDEYLTQGGNAHGIDADTLDREARLVAAAPDLLTALENALPWIIKAQNDHAFDGCAAPLGGKKAIERMQAAMDKARGA